MKLPQCKRLSAAGAGSSGGLTGSGKKAAVAAKPAANKLKKTGEGEMKFLDILRKLGILRYGAKSGTYTGMKDRPTEFMMDGVFNAEKDLVHKTDVKQAAAAVQSLTGRKVMFWLAAALGACVLLLLAAGGGITVWFGAGLILWGGYLAVLQRFAYAGRYSISAMVFLLLVLVFASWMFMAAARFPGVR
jgi:hypothetical protein